MEDSDTIETVREMDPKTFDSIDEKVDATKGEILRDKTIYFYLPIFVNLKTFEFTFSFFEIKYKINYLENLTCFKENKEVPEVVDINYPDLEHVNSLCLNFSSGLFYDTVMDETRASRLLVTYLYDEFYRSEMMASQTEDFILPLLLVKSPVTIDFEPKKCQYEKIETSKQKVSLADVMKKKQRPLTVRHFSLRIPHKAPYKVLAKSSKKMEKLNLKQFLSKDNLIEEQSNLNIKLMKWRLEPSLQLKPIQKLKVLLVGSGTLGCNMGRLLSAWGIRNIGFIDYGSVSYSNLTRQSLFTLNDFDVKGQGLSKAEAAVKNMKLLIPTINAKAYKFKIPMPGHSCTEEILKHEFENLQKLEDLIKEYDIVFNVLDSREARYFPTLFSGIYNKLCISVGLGYDNFVIVKHGYRNFMELIEKGKKGIFVIH
jgi:hypothetical protein